MRSGKKGMLFLSVLTLVMAAFVTAEPAEAQLRPREMPTSVGDSTGPSGPGPAGGTRFEPLAHEVTIPAGESARFETRSGGFSRVAVLAAGQGGSGEGMVGIVTLFGPPLVPSGPPAPLVAGPEGRIFGHTVQPVLGPAMVVVVNNGSSSDVVISLSAYFTR